MHNAEFNDPRLVTLYDAAFPWSRDDDFFLAVVSEFLAASGAPPAARVLDLGCGTGRLALAMAAAGYAVTGVDPAPASLRAARSKPGAGTVTWIDGTSGDLAADSFDAAVMTSHVAQFLVSDDEWRDALADLSRALVPGGMLTFDTRDPQARGWERWNPADSRREVTLPGGMVVTMWSEVTDISGGAVSSAIHYGFPGGEQLQSTAILRFRSEAEIRAALRQAGFTVEHIYGGWQREPVGAGDGELLVIARTHAPALTCGGSRPAAWAVTCENALRAPYEVL